MTALTDFIFQNLWISYMSLFIWIISIILMIKMDIGVLRGRGDFKNKKGKFENFWLTMFKFFLTTFIMILSLIFSIFSIVNIAKYSNLLFIIILLVMFVISLLVSLPIAIVEKGAESDFGLRWLINLIDKSDNKKKSK